MVRSSTTGDDGYHAAPSELRKLCAKLGDFAWLNARLKINFGVTVGEQGGKVPARQVDKLILG